MPEPPIRDRIALARRIIDFGSTPEDLGPRARGAAARAEPRAALGIDWPDRVAPQPEEASPEPATFEALPRADYLVVTWTAAEVRALADVLTPGVAPRSWYRYDRRFEEYLPKIRNGAPARMANRLGSWHMTRIGRRRVVCFKSELHLNQDGVRTGPGTATLPVADLFRQLIAEVQPKLVVTVGTAGAAFAEHNLGDVVVTRGAKFRLSKEFAQERFASKSYRSRAPIPTRQLPAARRLITTHADRLTEPPFGPPTTRYQQEAGAGGLTEPITNHPRILLDGVDFKAFHPILTTDFYEFGTSANRLDRFGCGIEMGDAVLGMVAAELGSAAPDWLVVRNVSDPLINADLPTDPIDMQAHWSTWYYEQYGYWTSVNSAIATWALIAGS